MTLTFFGGVGLFLLGMKLMTDGLKVAAGDALREILARGTATTPRGIASGVMITAMVQSSTAVIFATIGFVNAGLLTLFQAVGVIIGSNIGTTATSWLVAIVGFKVNLQALAMPAIAVGMALRVTGAGTRRGALGEALTGFGIFFLGIDILKETFGDLGEGADLERFADSGLLSLLLFVMIGIVLTVIMNSSSAALAVTLTAAGSGLIPLTAAAAMVIGANIGTTSTALFAVIGATSNAKRAALAHVIFNVITGIVAFAFLPFLLLVVAFIARMLGLDPTPAVTLAIFHTMTKVTGTTIMWPLTPFIVARLERLFVTAEEDEGRPRHLDSTLAGTPSLALEALNLELTRIGEIARRAAKESISAETSSARRLAQDKGAVDKLVLAVGDFSNRVTRSTDMPEELAGAFANGVRITQYYDDMLEHALEINGNKPGDIEDSDLAASIAEYKRAAVALINQADADLDGFKPKRLRKALKACEEGYQEAKRRLLHAGTAGHLPIRRMVAHLDMLSDIRRILDQASKAAIYSHKLRKLLHAEVESDDDDEDEGDEHAEAQTTDTPSTGDDATGTPAEAVEPGSEPPGDTLPEEASSLSDLTGRSEGKPV